MAQKGATEGAVAAGEADPGLVLLLLLMQLRLIHTRPVEVEPEGLSDPGEERREECGHVWRSGGQAEQAEKDFDRVKQGENYDCSTDVFGNRSCRSC